jgi:hypothetical protein
MSFSLLRARCPTRSTLSMVCFTSRASAVATVILFFFACAGSYFLGIRQNQTDVYDASTDPLQSILFKTTTGSSSEVSTASNPNANDDTQHPFSHHHGHTTKAIRRRRTPKPNPKHLPPIDIRSKLPKSSAPTTTPPAAFAMPSYSEPQLIYLAICIISDRRANSRLVRDAARRTYLYPLFRPEVAAKIQHWFVVGVHGASDAEMKALHEESEQFGDMLLLPLIDSCTLLIDRLNMIC